MAVAASGATEGEAWVHQIGFLAVASAIVKVWIVVLLVGCDIVQFGRQ